MATPVNLTISYTVSSGSPMVANVASQTVTIASLGGDINGAIRNITLAGGFLYSDPSGVETFIPLSTIVKITAQ
jgi:hypothetical protein